MRIPGKATNILFAVGLGVAAAWSFAATAADKGFYLGAGLGANWTRDADITGNGINTNAGFDTGFAGLLGVGWASFRKLRVQRAAESRVPHSTKSCRPA